MKINKNAFTLVELLVVVLIIGILAAIAVPQYQKAVMKSRYATIKYLANSIAQAEQVYYLANNSYTDNFEDLDIAMPSGKLNTSTNSNYIYDWGNCRIYTDGTYAFALCINEKTNMGYQIYYSTLNAKFCVVYSTSNETDIRRQICQAETGKTEAYTSQQDAWITYQY